MFTTALIAFREFLEAFLIIGVFWGVSRTFKLGKEKEIGLAAAAGFGIAFLMAIVTYLFGDSARNVLTEKNTDVLEDYLRVFSGFFLVYVIFSLHKVLHIQKMKVIKDVTEQLKQKTFDISLFFTIFFLVVREGFEIALFTASTSLFAVFFQNMFGLLIGFTGAGFIGIGTALSYVRFPVKRVFQFTEYLIILLGAALVQNGLTGIFEIYTSIDLSYVIPFHLSFLPDNESIIGHAIQTFTGIDQNLSGARLFIMAMYVVGVYMLFLKKSKNMVVKQ